MWILFLLLMTGIVQADQIFYNKNTGEILTISKDVVVLSDSDKSIIVSNKLPDNFDIKTLPKELRYYTYDGKDIKLNTKKISYEENAQVAADQAKQKTDTDKASAVGKLKGLGLSDDEVKVIIK